MLVLPVGRPAAQAMSQIMRSGPIARFGSSASRASRWNRAAALPISSIGILGTMQLHVPGRLSSDRPDTAIFALWVSAPRGMVSSDTKVGYESYESDVRVRY